MTEAVSIRQFRVEDADAVVELWRAVFPEYSDSKYPQRDPRANIARKLAIQPELFWVAERPAPAATAMRLIGSVMAGYDGHRGWIYALGVHPDARRAGVGRALLKQAESALFVMGCPKINLQVLSRKSGVRRFYEALGYSEDAVVSYGKRLI